jgi:hypothetical protein
MPASETSSTAGPQPGQLSLRAAIMQPAEPQIWNSVPQGQSPDFDGPTATIDASSELYVPEPQPRIRPL